jgi:4-hydroxythreonine-4-phosphate dehydrogenase
VTAPIAITTGEPAGIGPEISVAAAAASALPVVRLGDRQLLQRASLSAGVGWPLPPSVGIEHFAAEAQVVAGRLDARNARYVLRTLDAAIDGCRSGRYRAIATAPVHKGVINDAGVAFSGHTEYLAARLGCERPVMLLVAGSLRVALATTHLPLRAVPDALDTPLLLDTLSVLDQGLKSRFRIASPRILVCGLNPHAGESGHLGREEIDVIEPAVAMARQRGIDARGPLPADTAFTPASLASADAVLAMFHDQGLPVLKHAGFGRGVNVTLGLPIIRTSVDHGTALDLAASGRADCGSMVAALELACGMAS